MSGVKGMRRTSSRPEPPEPDPEREERDRRIGAMMPDIVVKGTGIFAPWDLGPGSPLRQMERFTGF